MKFSKGTVIKASSGIGVVLTRVQVAWGAERYKVMFSNGTIDFVWDKYMISVEIVSENTK
jgi:hypothetical protein